MNGTIAQIIALTCYGNTYLKNGNIRPFFPSNSTCKFCDKVNFLIPEKNLFGKTKEKEVAKNPDKWFEYLKKQKAKSLKLVHSLQNNPRISDRMSAGFFGGGGNWGIEVLLPNDKSEYWVAGWNVWDQKAPQQRIWRVSYRMVFSGKTPSDKTLPLTNAIDTLNKTLEEIRNFAERNELNGFAQCFAKALDTIRSAKKHGYHLDISPEGTLSKEAELILDACQSAWVFGGMGSWNDIGFDAKEHLEYERVSGQLFNNINSAIVTAANSSQSIMPHAFS